MIKYSIIIPTYNGQEKLRRCLEHISRLKKPEEGFEVIVVDNGSKDDTAEIAKSFEFARYYYDEAPGLHTGRHLGAKKAEGEILCYLDDDSFVDENYLLALQDTFSDSNVVLAGGNNFPFYEAEPPGWLNYFWKDSPWGSWMGELSLINFRNKKSKIPAWFVFGCNFIIKKSALFEYGGFNPDSMPFESIKYRGDGETALSCKLNYDGHAAYFNPNIRIWHFVPQSRMSLEYFKKHAYRYGISDSYSQIKKEHGFTYFNFDSNKNIDKTCEIGFFEKKYNKIKKSLFEKYDPDHKKYLEIKNECEKAYAEGFSFHQNEIRNDPELLKWVLKESYFD